MNDDFTKSYNENGYVILKNKIPRSRIDSLLENIFKLYCKYSNGSDDFQGVMKQIRKKDHTIENPKFKIFDMVSVEEFNRKESYTKLLLRLDMLKSSIGYCDISSDIIEILHQEEVTSEEVFNKWSKLSSDNNWEGFMLRKNETYKAKIPK